MKTWLEKEWGRRTGWTAQSGEICEIIGFLIPLEFETKRLLTAALDLRDLIEYNSGYDEDLPHIHLETALGREIVMMVDDEIEFDEVIFDLDDVLGEYIEHFRKKLIQE